MDAAKLIIEVTGGDVETPVDSPRYPERPPVQEQPPAPAAPAPLPTPAPTVFPTPSVPKPLSVQPPPEPEFDNKRYRELQNRHDDELKKPLTPAESVELKNLTETLNKLAEVLSKPAPVQQPTPPRVTTPPIPAPASPSSPRPVSPTGPPQSTPSRKVTLDDFAGQPTPKVPQPRAFTMADFDRSPTMGDFQNPTPRPAPAPKPTMQDFGFRPVAEPVRQRGAAGEAPADLPKAIYSLTNALTRFLPAGVANFANSVAAMSSGSKSGLTASPGAGRAKTGGGSVSNGQASASGGATTGAGAAAGGEGGMAAGIGELAAVAGPAAIAVGAFAIAGKVAEKALSHVGDRAVELAGNKHMGALEDAAKATELALLAFPVVGPMAAGAIATLIPVTKEFTKVAEAFIERGRYLQRYDSNLAAANAKANVRSTLADVRESQALSPDLSRLTDNMSQIETSIRDLMLPIKEAIGSLLAEVSEGGKEIFAILREFAPVVKIMTKILMAIPMGAIKMFVEIITMFRKALEKWPFSEKSPPDDLNAMMKDFFGGAATIRGPFAPGMRFGGDF